MILSLRIVMSLPCKGPEANNNTYEMFCVKLIKEIQA